MRNKHYMRRISVGGTLGTVTWISGNKKWMVVEHSKEIDLGDAGSMPNPEHETINLPRPSTVTKVGQKVRIFAKPI